MTDQDRSLEETQPIGTSAPEEAWWTAGSAPPTPTEPVKPPRRSGTVRWVTATVAIVAVLAVAAAGTILLTGRAAPPTAYAYLPADTAMLVELRPDLPGDQREKLATLLSKFPGFADQATLETKLDETLDRVIDRTAGRDIDYATQVKPFLGGPILVAATKVADDPGTKPIDGFLAIATTDGTVQCAKAPFDHLVDTVVHNGQSIAVLEREGTRYGCFIDGRTVLLGPVAEVQRALDTKGSVTSLAADKDLETARSKLSGDTLGFVYLSKAGFSRLAEVSQRRAASSGPGSFDPAALPSWFMAGIRAEDDGLLFDAVMPMPTRTTLGLPLGSLPPPKVSTLATRLPKSTIATFEVRSLGPMIKNMLDGFQADPKQADALKQVDAALMFLGGRDAILGWLGDASVVVTRDGETFAGGLVVEAADEARASATFTQLRTLVGFAGSQGLSVSEEAYGSGTITTISFDSRALGSATAGRALTGLPPKLDIAYTVQKGIVAVGVGSSDFVKSVIDTASGSSLADQPRYKAAMAMVGANNSGEGYVDVAAGIDAFQKLGLPMIPDADRTAYERDIAPYVAPLDAVAWSSTVEGGYGRVRLAFTAHAAR